MCVLVSVLTSHLHYLWCPDRKLFLRERERVALLLRFLLISLSPHYERAQAHQPHSFLLWEAKYWSFEVEFWTFEIFGCSFSHLNYQQVHVGSDGECCDRHDAGQREKAVMRQDSNWNTPHWLTAETIATVTRTLSLLHDGLTSGHSYQAANLSWSWQEDPATFTALLFI